MAFAVIDGTIAAAQIVKAGGQSNQFLMADGTTKTAAIIEVADEYTLTTGVGGVFLTAGKTSFALTQGPSSKSKVKMYINGIRISNTAYSWDGTDLTYNPANNGNKQLTTEDRVQFDYYTEYVVIN
jgi:hypothetical protein